jgi:hypothetical protein
MRKYTKVDVSEQTLEDLVRRNAGLIGDGLVYVDHQRHTGSGRLDVLMVDSGKSLVVAELKVVEDDGMLLQGLDYCDYVSTHVESYARLYETHAIDPVQQVSLLLIAPSFSQVLVNRCKWLTVPVALYVFNCLRFEGDDEIVPVFTEQQIPLPPKPPAVITLDHVLTYITDDSVRAKVTALLEEMKMWKPGNITHDPIQGGISIKVNGRVFAYIWPRRKHYVIQTLDADDAWKQGPVETDDDLAMVKPLARAAMERKSQ